VHAKQKTRHIKRLITATYPSIPKVRMLKEPYLEWFCKEIGIQAKSLI
jgi:hypothetical protein